MIFYELKSIILMIVLLQRTYFMKRTARIPALDLDKVKLQEIEKEISSPWYEAREEIKKTLRSNFLSHNTQVKKSGYSYILSTDSVLSRKIFTKKEIDSLVEDEGSIFFKKIIQYPLKPPVISYNGQKFETDSLSNIDELYKCNIESNFKTLKIEVYGFEGKYIILNFTSDSSYFRFPEGNRIEVNYPQDESVGVLERVQSHLEKYEAPRSVFHTGIFKIIFQLVIPFFTVFAFNKVFKIVAPTLLEQDTFYTFVSMFLYFLVLITSMAYCDKLYNLIFPNTILSDCVSGKRKWFAGEGVLFLLGVFGIDYIIEAFKAVFSFFNK